MKMCFVTNYYENQNCHGLAVTSYERQLKCSCGESLVSTETEYGNKCKSYFLPYQSPEQVIGFRLKDCFEYFFLEH